MSNSLDPDQARHFVRPDLGPNCLQRLSADDKAATIGERVKNQGKCVPLCVVKAGEKGWRRAPKWILVCICSFILPSIIALQPGYTVFDLIIAHTP